MANALVPTLDIIYLYITPYCNLNCKHCWTSSIRLEESKEEVLPLEGIKEVILQGVELGAKAVKITGGEPFIRDDLFDLLYWLKGLKLDISIETNATLIGAKEAKALKETGVSTVTCALDGPNPHIHEQLRRVPGSFEKSIKGMKELKKYNIKTFVIMCLYRKNIDELRDTILLAKKLGVVTFKIHPIIPVGRGSEMQNENELLTIEEILNCYNQIKFFNNIGMNIFFDIPLAFVPINKLAESTKVCNIHHVIGVLSNGDISICGIGYAEKELIFGNVRKENLIEVWNHNKILRLMREKIPSQLEGICKRCVFKNYCLGKCRALAYSCYKSLTAPHPFCQQAYELGFFPEDKIIEEVRFV